MTSIHDSDYSYEMRIDMIASQIESRGIQDPQILQAFLDIPRHIFIPDFNHSEAYSDRPQPIKSGQTISQPFIVALMLSYMELDKTHSVLEIGSGSGYATAVLSKLASHIDAFEVYGDLVQDSVTALELLEINNATVHHNSAWEQIDTNKVYDRIILWASPPKIPDYLFQLLKNDGILVAPEGKADQYVWIHKKEAGELQRIRKDAVRFVPLLRGSTEEIDFSMRGSHE